MQPERRRSAQHARVAIVGAGLSGLRVADALAESSPHAEILVLETGPFSRRQHEGRDRCAHPGDARVQCWSASGSLWGKSSGLKPRVGGRSLCWHGQLLSIEDYALADWPAVWRERLRLFCNKIVEELAPASQIDGTPLADWRHAGLQAVPQAANLAVDRRGVVRDWCAYSPLDAVHRRTNVRLMPGGAVTKVESTGGVVRIFQRNRDPLDVDVCVLSAGAIGNVALLARSLEQPLAVPLCDHLCSGAVMAFHGAAPEVPAMRGEATLLGYLPDPAMRANLFFQELPPVPGGPRAIDAWVLAEQAPSAASTLVCTPASGDMVAVTIEPLVTNADADRTKGALGHAVSLMERVLGSAGEIIELSEEADAIVHAQQKAGIVACYERPIGTVDHEACTHSIGSLCSEDLSVPSLPGVYLNGPGVFPRAGAANPGLTILAVASWLAESLRLRLA